MLAKEENLNLLTEPSHIREERDTVSKTLTILKKAQKVLKRDPDLASGVISKKEGKDGHSKSEKPHKKEDMFGPGKAN